MAHRAYEYDIIIAGGGLAGRSLAYFLSREWELDGKTILILDPDHEGYPDRSLIYWPDGVLPLPLQPEATYIKLAIDEGSTQRILPLQRHRLCLTSSRVVFKLFDEVIDANPRIERLAGKVSRIMTRGDQVEVLLSDGRSYRAAYCFDSTSPPSGLKAPLVMSGEVRRIRTSKASFDPSVATFLDFRSGEHTPVHFFCVLPFSNREALVEIPVIRSPGPEVPALFFEDALSTYLSNIWGAGEVSVLSVERGTIPLGIRAARPRRRHVRIGTPSGAVKATTGYGFTRILRQSEQIASSFASTGSPTIPRPPSRFRWYDIPVLRMWRKNPEQVVDFMKAAFTSGDADLVLDFLAERTTFSEERTLLESMPITTLLNPRRGRSEKSTSA